MSTEKILKMGDKRKILDDNMLPYDPQIVAAINATEQFVLQSEKIKQALADSQRIDWLAAPTNTIGNVQLPTEIVERNLHSMRDAIDEARKANEDK